MFGCRPVILKQALSTFHLSSRHRGAARVSYDIQEIRHRLAQFPGGDVTLSKRPDGIGVITIDNASKKNAFSGSMCVALRDAVSELHTWHEGKCVVLRAVGGTFCSGADLSMVKSIANHDDGDRFSYFMQSTLTELLNLPLLSVAVIDGGAFGGGAELATACDLRAFTGRGTIGFVQARMGVVPGWGGGTRLVRLVGRPTALRILLGARAIRADDAVQAGLADHVFKEEDIRVTAAGLQQVNDNDVARDSAVLQLASKWVSDLVAPHPKEVVRSMKTMVSVASTDHFDESLQVERQLFKRLWGGEANLKALARNLKHD